MNIPENPAPNFSKRPIETQAAAVDLIMELIMNSSGVPEHLKIGVRIMDAYKKFAYQLVAAAKHFSKPAKTREENESLLPERQEFFEYLQLMKAGLDSFLAAHPITPPHRLCRAGV